VKYIMFENFAGEPLPVIFPDRIDHREMRDQIPYPAVLSAGYVEHTESGFHCFGESKCLKKSYRSEDAGLITEAFQPV